MEQELAAAVAVIEQRNPKQINGAFETIENLILQNPKSFTQTQGSFALNVAGRLISQLNAFLSPEDSSEYDFNTCITALRVLRGCCLLHRPSRQLFNNEPVLQLVLTNGMKHSNSEIQVACIDLLISSLVRQVETIRLFEECGGLKLVCDVFKQSRTPTSVKLAILQFLFFYLVPETRFPEEGRKPPRLTTQDKQAILGKYLSNVDGLVRELEMNKPFGDIEIEW